MNNNLVIIPAIALVLSLVILFLAISRYLSVSSKLRKQELELKRYEIDLNNKNGESTFELLDSLIQEEFNKYLIFHIDINEAPHLNSEMEEQLAKGVGFEVRKNISPALIAKLSSVCNIKNLDAIIANRVYLSVMNYSINKEKNNEE